MLFYVLDHNYGVIIKSSDNQLMPQPEQNNILNFFKCFLQNKKVCYCHLEANSNMVYYRGAVYCCIDVMYDLAD